MVVPPLFVKKIRFVAAAKGMAADSSPSRSHTRLRTPQCPLRTLQFIGPPFSFLSRRTKSSSNGPKVKAPSSPGTAGPTRGRVILTWVHWITPKDGGGMATGWTLKHGRFLRASSVHVYTRREPIDRYPTTVRR